MITLLVVIVTGSQVSGDDPALLLGGIHQLHPIRPVKGHTRATQPCPLLSTTALLRQDLTPLAIRPTFSAFCLFTFPLCSDIHTYYKWHRTIISKLSLMKSKPSVSLMKPLTEFCSAENACISKSVANKSHGDKTRGSH